MPADFDSLRVGDEAEVEHTICETDVSDFVTLTGDANRVHVDKEYARATSLRKTVVHGMLTASFISTLIGTKLPGDGALLYEQHLNFLSPVRVGETIRVRGRVQQKSVTQRILVLKVVVYGNDGRRVLDGEAKVKVLETTRRAEGHAETGMNSPKRGAVIVTGSSRGIGASIALALAREGHSVVVNYLRDEQAAAGVVQEIETIGGRAVACQGDISESGVPRALIDKALLEFGPIRGVVNNASPRLTAVEFGRLSWTDMQRQVEVQLKGAFLMAQEVLPHLIPHGDGVIVNIGSVAVDDVPPVKMTHYVVVKAAVIALTKCLAAEYGPRGIRINCVSPGMTMTDMTSEMPAKSLMIEKMRTPLRRLSQAEDIAGVVAFLFDEKARHITGQNLRVCGGAVMV